MEPRSEAGRALVQRLGWFASEKGDALREGVVAIETEAHNLALDAVSEAVGRLPLYDECDRIVTMGGDTREPRTMADAAEAFQTRVLRIIEEARRG